MNIFSLLERVEDSSSLQFEMHTVGAKRRQIAVPSASLYELQQLLLRHLQSFKPVLPAAYGGVPKRSALSNAYLHRRGKYFFIIDFENAFPSIDATRLARVLISYDPSLGTFGEVVDFLEQYCMVESGGLAQGGPASPLLFNLYCESEVDQQLRHLLSQTDEVGLPTVVYSRYIDDLTFSSERPFPRVLRRKINDIVREAGFSIHPQKRRLLAMGKDAIEVTGMRILPNGMLALSRELEQKLLRTFGDWLSTDQPVNTEYVRGLVGYYRGLKGRLADRRPHRLLGMRARQVEERLLWPRQSRSHIFPDNWLQELKVKVPLDEVLGRCVKKLKWRGGNREAVGLCPFHNEKTPSFTFVPTKGFYHCFGCGAHGDIFSFVIRTESLTFKRAVITLAQRFNIPLPEGVRLPGRTETA